ncbi:MAG: molybdenum cofactor guanylyltransferase [Qipengyuania sp.]|nr:molybdenum cofactor guanylyltransferase [Qipengyuania sp.]
MRTRRATLGAVLAGGRASRFGSDKAVAKAGGQALLDIALAALAPQCDAVCVVGRRAPGLASLADWPAPGMGPLGGIAAALRHAGERGFAEVLTVPVDVPDLPPDLRARLEPAPACLADLPVAGLWPIGALPLLEAIVTRPGRHAVRDFATACEARLVALGHPLANINTPADLALWRQRR